MSDTGYTHCACRDCFETTVGRVRALTYCDGCETAGCPDYQGQPGMSQECQREDAYGSGLWFAFCTACGHEQETEYDATGDECECGGLLA